MSDLPIYAAAEEALHARQAIGQAIIEHLIARGIIRHHTEGEPTMGLFADAKDDLDKFTDDLKTWTTTGYQDVTDFIENKAPKWSAALDNAAQNPAIDALLNATNLSPGYLQGLAQQIQQVDQDVANARAAAPAPEVAQ